MSCRLSSVTTVTIAIPEWRGRVSPVFDSAVKVVLFSARQGGHGRHGLFCLSGDGPLERARSLQGLGVQVLICGAISRPMEIALTGAGIKVISNTCGQVEQVWNAFLNGRVNEREYQMPGSLHWRIRRLEAPYGGEGSDAHL